MNDMKSTIVPKSDQLNADDLLSGPITIKITEVTIKGGQEQPVSIHYEGDNGKPYKSCKSMNRVLVTAWGADASKYVGRSLTLYCDPKVKWGGMEVGGIRISHMSDIDSTLTMALTVTRANKKPFTVKPINAAAPQTSSAETSNPAGVGAAAAPTIDADQVVALETALQDAGITVESFKKRAKLERLALMTVDRYAPAMKWIQEQAAQ